MKLITTKVINFISELLPLNTTYVDLTWFNQYNNHIDTSNSSFIVAVDVADPPYFFEEKVNWIKSVNKPIIYVGPLVKNLPCPVVPFFGWLRFRPQIFKSKQNYDGFFVSFNRKAHSHRKYYFNTLKNFPNIMNNGYISFFEDIPKHEIAPLSLDNDIVKLQSLAQIIDEKQLYSAFEIVCETSASTSHIFLTEKFNKCIASETPLLFLGDYKTLTILKSYYGFTDFGPDDSYDEEPNYAVRVAKVLSIASNFYSYPVKKAYDNAKRNAEHLHENFDAIHDKYVFKHLLKALKSIK
jgi:hypothetical protein